MGKWKPSKTRIKQFINTMSEVDRFCDENCISQSASSDSYYFTINGQRYRVSNHSIEASNDKAYNSLGQKVRECYHESQRNENIIYIHASKTRIIEIYNNLKCGYVLDGKGNIKR